MHSSRIRSVFRSFALFSLTLGLFATPLLAEVDNRPDEPLVEVSNSSTKIVWEPRLAFGFSELVISAPDGNIFQRYFEPGETLVFSIFDVEFDLCDGNYGWEVRFMPRGELQTRKVSNPFLPVTNGKRTFRGTVIGGNIGVKNGKLVDPITNGKEGAFADHDPGGLAQPKDFVINDDLIVDGSACIGFDCVNGESFSFDTIRLKENNLRIKFQDTSTAASFPTTDWQLTANASANGGASKFSIDDISGGRTPFTVEANAPSHSLYVDDGGRLGLGTSTPSVDVHVISGDSPTVRLEQNGSSGFAPQTWDVAGNETNFFVRDASNGSQLPFRIRPGAPTSSIFIDTDGDVGIGTASPSQSLHVRGTGGDTQILVEEASGTAAERTLFQATNNGKTRFTMARTDLAGTAAADWSFAHGGDNFEVTKTGTGVLEMTLNATSGDLTIMGDFVSNGTPLDVPDYVFEDDYPLMPLDQLATFIEAENHLPGVPSAEEINGSTLNITQMQMKLLEKVEELTLYTLGQQATISELTENSQQQQSTIAELKAALAALQADSSN